MLRLARRLTLLALLMLAAAPLAAQHPAAPASAPPPLIEAGDLVIAAPFTRATPSGARVAAGYMRITNRGATPDRLVGGSAAFAGRVEIHEMAVTNGVMRMRPLAQGLEIKPGETVELRPGGLHVMFLDLAAPLQAHSVVRGTLHFERAGTVEISFVVAPLGATGAEPRHRH